MKMYFLFDVKYKDSIRSTIQDRDMLELSQIVGEMYSFFNIVKSLETRELFDPIQLRQFKDQLLNLSKSIDKADQLIKDHESVIAELESQYTKRLEVEKEAALKGALSK